MMNDLSKIQPGQTGAIVVGIDVYPGQPEWKIPGAADAASSFAQWLKDRGVSRVVELITRKGTSQGASTAHVQCALFETVKKWGKDVHLLFVYWAGHGVIDRKDADARLLLCDEATVGNPQALPFEEYRAAMRDTAFPPYQVFLVDACAVDWPGVAINRGADPPPRSAPDDHRRQFVLYSTSPGQVSPAVSVAGPSPFPEALRVVLNECKCGWPPDMPTVAAQVKLRLAAAGVIQRPRFHSIDWDGNQVDLGLVDPAAVGGETIDPKNVEGLAKALDVLPHLAGVESQAAFLRGLSGGMAYGLKTGAPGFSERLARNILAAPRELGELFEALARDGFGLAGTAEETEFFDRIDAVLPPAIQSWRDLVRLIRALVGHKPEAVERWATEAAIGHPAVAEDDRFTLSALRRPALAAALLAQLPRRDNSLPLVTFAARLADHVPDPPQAALKAWVTELGHSLGVGVPAVVAAAPAAPRSTCFSVVLFPLKEDAGKFEVRAWRRDDTHPEPKEITEADNQQTLAKVARFVNDRAGHDIAPKVEVELFVPTAVLAEGLAPWEVNVTEESVMRIDERYPVTLRSWDRSFGRSRDFDQPARMAWHKRWGQCPLPGHKADGEHLADLYDDADYDLRTMVGKHRKKGPVTVAAALAAPRPGAAIDPAQVVRVLHNLLVAGMPIAVWPEAGSVGGASPLDVRDKLHTFIMGDALDQLSRRVHRHQNGEDPMPDRAWQLCLFWDDPTCVPSLVGHQLTQPAVG
jgi:hypothetical protein